MAPRNADIEAPPLSLAPLAVDGAGLLGLGTNTARSAERVAVGRSLFVSILAISTVAHLLVAVHVSKRSAYRAPRPRSQVEVEMTRAPRPKPPEPPPPPPEPLRASPPRNAAVPPRPAAPQPRAAVAGLPEGDEGTVLPAPTAEPEPVAAAGEGPPGPPAPVAPPPPPPPAPIVEAKEGANYLKNPRPAYPRLAKREGWQGMVLLRVRVLPNGRADAVTLQRTSGRNVLDDAALEAVKAWTFVPATQGGQAIAGWVTVPIEFRLQ